MTDPTQLLNDIAHSLRIVGAPAAVEPGVPLSLGLTPEIRPTALTDVIQSPLTLDLADGKLLGGITGNLPVGLPTGPIDRPVDLDLAGDLTGKLTGLLPIVRLSQIAPKIEIAWVVKDEHGTELIANKDYVAPDGLNALLFNLILIPKFTEAGLQVAPVVTRSISAVVTLRTGGSILGGGTVGSAPVTAHARGMGGLGGLDDGVTVQIAVPPVHILVPQIPFPRLLVLAKDLQFRGPVAVLLPKSSFASSIPTVLDLLKRVQSVLSLLTSVAKLAATLAGINALINMLEAPHIGVGFASGDNKINNLNDIDVDAGPWYSRWNDTEAEDEMSSFVYVGPPKSSVAMFADRDCDTDEGAFRVTVGDALVALSRSLHGPVPDLFPKADDGLVFGAKIDILKARSNFGNCLSSIQFS